MYRKRSFVDGSVIAIAKRPVVKETPHDQNSSRHVIRLYTSNAYTTAYIQNNFLRYLFAFKFSNEEVGLIQHQ